ncbi:hypothetical protein E3P77_03950 [Wallemia ichthyophaga]|nr:hypothetical protein E3P77_03950 [Wallemia ichthyophaga]
MNHSSPYSKTQNKKRRSTGFSSFYNLISSPFKSSYRDGTGDGDGDGDGSGDAHGSGDNHGDGLKDAHIDSPMDIEELGAHPTEDLIDWRQPDDSQQTNNLLSNFFKDKGNRSLTSEEAVQCFKLIGSSIQQPPLDQSQNIPSVALFSPGTSTTPTRKPQTSSVNAFLSPARSNLSQRSSVSSRNSRQSLGGSLSARKRPIYMGAGFGSPSQSNRRNSSSSLENVGRSIGVGSSLPIDTGKRRRTDDSNADSKQQQQQQEVENKKHQQSQPKLTSTPSKSSHLSVPRFSKPATVVRPSPLRQVQTAESQSSQSPSPEKSKQREDHNTPSKLSSRAADAVLGVLGDEPVSNKPSNETINPYQNNNPVARISKSRTPRPSKLRDSNSRKSVAPEKKTDGEKSEENKGANVSALDLIEQTDPSKNKRKADENELQQGSATSNDLSKPSFDKAEGRSQPETGAFGPLAAKAEPSPKKQALEMQSTDRAFGQTQPQNSSLAQSQSSQPKPTFASSVQPTPPSPKPPAKTTETIDIDSDSDVDVDGEKEEDVEQEKEEESDEMEHDELEQDEEEMDEVEEAKDEEPAKASDDDKELKEDQVKKDKAQPQPSQFPSFPSFSTAAKEAQVNKVEGEAKDNKSSTFVNIFPASTPTLDSSTTAATATTPPSQDAKDKAQSKAVSEIPSFTFNSLLNIPVSKIAPGLEEKVEAVPSISFAIRVDEQPSTVSATPATLNPLWAAAKQGGNERSCSICMCKSPSSAGNNMEIGADGKPCKVCNSFKSWSKQQRKGGSGSSGSGSNITNTNNTNNTNNTTNNTQTQSNIQKLAQPTLADKFGCPVDADQLGRQTWTFLHTAASYYPHTASISEQTQMKNLISSVGSFYPCGDCASHLRSYVKQQPPQVHTRSALELWMCQMHNDVNARLGKDIFDCDKVPQRWRDGWLDESCD